MPSTDKHRHCGTTALVRRIPETFSVVVRAILNYAVSQSTKFLYTVLQLLHSSAIHIQVNALSISVISSSSSSLIAVHVNATPQSPGEWDYGRSARRIP